MDKKEMLEKLEEFYECAGFENYHDRVLKDMSDKEIEDLYFKTFREEDREFVNWERRFRGDW